MVKFAGAAANLAKKVELVKSNRVKEDVYAESFFFVVVVDLPMLARYSKTSHATPIVYARVGAMQ
jgi:hypothetical protein